VAASYQIAVSPPSSMTIPPARSLLSGENGIVEGLSILQFSSLIDEEPNHLELDPSR
jgi:hypothetical protein